MIEARGWAVRSHGRILPNTVSETRRAAIVNWLVTVPGIMITNTANDDDIEALWMSQHDQRDTQVIIVRIMQDDA